MPPALCPRKPPAAPQALLSAPPPNPQVLLTYKGQDLAVLEVDSKWVPNKVRPAAGLTRPQFDCGLTTI
jgi:hypothetical protein